MCEELITCRLASLVRLFLTRYPWSGDTEVRKKSGCQAASRGPWRIARHPTTLLFSVRYECDQRPCTGREVQSLDRSRSRCENGGEGCNDGCERVQSCSKTSAKASGLPTLAPLRYQGDLRRRKLRPEM